MKKVTIGKIVQYTLHKAYSVKNMINATDYNTTPLSKSTPKKRKRLQNLQQYAIIGIVKKGGAV